MEIKFSRNCPHCNDILFYKFKGDFNRAVKSNSGCIKCANINQNTFTPEDDLFLINNYQKLGAKKCAQILNKHAGTIANKAFKLKLKYGVTCVDSINNKICSCCKLEKPKTTFYKSKNKKEGLHYYCKECALNKNNSLEYKEYKYKYDKQYRRNKLETDINYKLRLILRKRVRNALFAKGISKKYDTFSLIGCSVNELKIYLESKFTKGMTWKNYGNKGWHIDHIKPCCLFDLTKEDEQRKCFHYTNMQPLWATSKIAVQNGESKNYIGNLNKWRN